MRKLLIASAVLLVLALLAWAAGPTIQAGLIVLNGTTLAGGGGGTMTFQNATDTVVGRATTDTLTHKTFNTAGAGNVFQINGTTLSSVSGNTSKVLLETGTATSGNFVKFDANGNAADSGFSAVGSPVGVYNTSWAKSDSGLVASPASAPTTKTLSQADLVANAEWVLTADYAVQDVGGGSPTLHAIMRLGGQTVCDQSCVGASCNNITMSVHQEVRIKVLTTGAGGTAKAQCFGNVTAGSGAGSFGPSNTADTTFSINTTANVTVDWQCTDSLNSLHCIYYDNLFYKIN